MNSFSGMSHFKMDAEQERYLKDVYFNPGNPASFAGPLKLYKFVQKDGKYKIPLPLIKTWLQGEETFTTQKQVNRKFVKQKIVVPHMNYQYEADTANMTYYAQKNDGYGYFVVVIDAFSRFAYTKALKTTTGSEMSKTLSEIFEKHSIPLHLRTDAGTEFVNSSVKKVLKKYNIKHVVTRNEVKCAIAERFIKTLKTKITRFMVKKHNPRWVDILQDMTNSYNHTYHRTLGMAPADVNKSNENELWKKMYQKIPRPHKKPHPKDKYKFEIGDVVRLSKLKYPFQREYDIHWTPELFSVSDRTTKQGLSIYKVKDYGNEPIQGSFYTNELQRVHARDDASYNIDIVIKRRKRKGVREVFVSWQGWPSKYNSWVKESEMEKF